MNSTPPARASVIISTKNRKEELRKTVASAISQSARPEVLVFDDGSTDGTSNLIRSEFPGVKLHRFDTSEGYITRRNQGAKLATAPFVFSIDDDAIFSTPHVVEQTLADFDDPRVAAVAIPFINVNQDAVLRQSAGDSSQIQVAPAYIGTAHALRREPFLQLGGYQGALVHQGEEDDFCARLYDAGYVVRLGRAEPIHHFESPNRNWGRMTYYGQRNNILYAWQNVPMPDVLVHLPATSLKGLIFGVKVRRFWLTVKGQSVALGQIVAENSRAGRFAAQPINYCASFARRARNRCGRSNRGCRRSVLRSRSQPRKQLAEAAGVFIQIHGLGPQSRGASHFQAKVFITHQALDVCRQRIDVVIWRRESLQSIPRDRAAVGGDDHRQSGAHRLHDRPG